MKSPQPILTDVNVTSALKTLEQVAKEHGYHIWDLISDEYSELKKVLSGNPLRRVANEAKDQAKDYLERGEETGRQLYKKAEKAVQAHPGTVLAIGAGAIALLLLGHALKKN